MLLNIKIEHSSIGKSGVFLQRSGLSGVKVVQEGKVISPSEGNYAVLGNNGETVNIRLDKPKSFLDLPVAFVDGERVMLAPPLKAYEIVLISMPLLLMFGGGAVGGALGACALGINAKLMRKCKGIAGKLISGIFVFATAVIAYFAIASVLTDFFQ